MHYSLDVTDNDDDVFWNAARPASRTGYVLSAGSAFGLPDTRSAA